MPVRNPYNPYAREYYSLTSRPWPFVISVAAKRGFSAVHELDSGDLNRLSNCSDAQIQSLYRYLVTFDGTTIDRGQAIRWLDSLLSLRARVRVKRAFLGDPVVERSYRQPRRAYVPTNPSNVIAPVGSSHWKWANDVIDNRLTALVKSSPRRPSPRMIGPRAKPRFWHLDPRSRQYKAKRSGR